MAKKKKRKSTKPRPPAVKGRESAPATPAAATSGDDAPTQGAHADATSEPTGALVWLARATTLGDAAVAIGALLLSLAMGVFELQTAYTGLQTAAATLLGLTAALLAGAAYMERRGHPPQRAMWALSLALMCGILALMAMIGRDDALHGSPFELSRTSFAGFPSELPFIAMAACAAVIAQRQANHVTHLVLVGATLWATAALIWPVYQLSGSHVPLMTALDGLSSTDGRLVIAGICHTLLAVQVGCAWWLLWQGTTGEPQRAVAGTVQSGHLVLVATHLLAAAAGEGETSFVIAAVLWIIGTAATRLLGRYHSLDEAVLRHSSALGTRVADVLVPGVIVGLYALLKTHGMGPSNTDENIYFYMAHDIAENGRWPYTDFFFAHPPMHLAIPALVYDVFGYSVSTAKLISATAGGVAGLAVWAIGRRHLGRFAAAVALVSFLFAAETLKASTNMTGINLTTMWLLLGVWQSLKGHGLRAGVLLGLSAMTGLYAAAAICACLLLGVFRRDERGTPVPKRFWVRQLGATVVVFYGLHLIFSSMGGDAYTQGVFEYHGQKRLQDLDMVDLTGLGSLFHNLGVMVDGAPFTKEIYYHGHLWITLFTAPLLGGWVYYTSPDGNRSPWRFFDPRRLWNDGAHGRAGILWLIALALFIQYAMFRELYSFYFTLIYPFLALLVGYTLEHAVRLGAQSLSAEGRRSLLMGSVTVLSIFAVWLPWAANAGTIFNEHSVLTGRLRGAASGGVHLVSAGDALELNLDRHFKIKRRRNDASRSDTPPPHQLQVGVRYAMTGKEITLGRLKKRRGSHRFPLRAGVAPPTSGDTVFLRWAKFPERRYARTVLGKGQLGRVNDYIWREAPVLGSASGIVRELFWADTRIKGHIEPGYRYYLWTKKRSFESLERVAQYVRDNTTAEETVAGGSTLAPLVALEAGRRLAGDEVDTNSKRFSSGILKERDFWQRICADNLKLIVSIQRSYFNTNKMNALKTVRRWFRRDRVFEDAQLSYGRTFRIVLYKRTGDAPCQWEDGAPTPKKAPTTAPPTAPR